jgi:O-antigen/teichoic acid export membrane protein
MATATEPPLRFASGRLNSSIAQLYSLIQPDKPTEEFLFVQRVAGTFVVRVGLVAIGFLSSIATARLLGPYGRGIYAAAIVLVALASQLANLGMQVSNTFYVAGQRSLLPRLISNSLLVSLLGGSLSSLLVMFLFCVRPNWAPVRGAVLVIALTLIPVTLASLLLQNLLLGIQEVKWYNISDITGKAFFLVLCGILALKGRWTATSFMAIAFASVLMTVFITTGRLLSIVHSLPFPDLHLMWRQAGYGFKSYVVSIAAYVVLKADVLMVKQMAGSVAAGFYSLASSMTDYVYMFPTVVGMMLFPALSATASPLRRWNRAKKTTLVVTAIMALLSLCTAAGAKPLIELVYGREFLPALPAFVVLCMAIVFYSANNVVSIYFSSCGLPWFSVWIWPVAAGFNVILNLYFIKHWGIIGASVSSLVTYSSLFAVQYRYASVTAAKEHCP